MKKPVTNFALLILFVIFTPLWISAQGFGQWTCNYATIDADPNATGNRTISVASYGENNFTALVADFPDSCYYLVGYKDADSTKGRLGKYQYSGKGQITYWLSGFDQVLMTRAKDIEHRKVGDDNLIFVANNDPEKNILVFKMTADSFETYPLRLSTIHNVFNPKNIWAIDIDAAGRVYVTTEGDSLNPSEILVFESPDKESAWSSGFQAAPLQIITLPDNGDARGVTVNPEGTVIYVSNYVTKKVYCYIGDATNGYTLYSGFNFAVTDVVTDGTTTILPGPWGLNYLPNKNILFVSSATDYQNTTLGYSYGKVFLLDPNNGSELGVIDCAEWNFNRTGAYNSNTPGNVSGYASPYNCDFDEKENVYIVSYYGWTVDKWSFSTDLPTIDLTITSVEKIGNTVPAEFSVNQNYPNPFNPTTTIEFSVSKSSQISLSVYSLNGELVTNLLNSSNFASGVYRITFDASKLASGTYIYTINDGTQSISKKMILLK
ncbi:MAG: T9SS type A sorting domain-containing protein [Bacteroidetes bacterium]|nr:T9SS type A sorting domain-containing protein [Bacteroidota bacterium]